jgi:hypothetical protein
MRFGGLGIRQVSTFPPPPKKGSLLIFWVVGRDHQKMNLENTALQYFRA